MFCALQGNKGLHLLRHSDCRTVGRVVAPDSRDPRFESIRHHFKQIENTKRMKVLVWSTKISAR